MFWVLIWVWYHWTLSCLGNIVILWCTVYLHYGWSSQSFDLNSNIVYVRKTHLQHQTSILWDYHKFRLLTWPLWDSCDGFPDTSELGTVVWCSSTVRLVSLPRTSTVIRGPPGFLCPCQGIHRTRVDPISLLLLRQSPANWSLRSLSFCKRSGYDQKFVVCHLVFATDIESSSQHPGITAILKYFKIINMKISKFHNCCSFHIKTSEMCFYCVLICVKVKQTIY